MAVEGSRVDRELELLRRGVRAVLVVVVMLLVVAVGLLSTGPRGPHRHGDGGFVTTDDGVVYVTP